jgi:DNA (cytosine-5)-methyltransferase 1
MDIDWMTNEELVEAIPPAYTEFLGRQLLAEVRRRAVGLAA